MKNVWWIATCYWVLVLASCGGGGANPDAAGKGNATDATSEDSGGTGATMEAGGLKLTAVTGSPEYAGAKLGLVNPPAGADLAAGTNRFEFTATGFELGKPTADQDGKGVAFNPNGQYAGLILNNGPVVEMTSGTSDQALQDGHYVMLAIPCRSYHESAKEAGGHILRQFNVGQPDSYKELDTKAPHIFYHWPAGTLKGAAETGKVLLDFYLVNCSLAPDGYKVKLTLNGTAFTLTTWSAYTMEGLPMGEVKIELELLDASGARVESPYNPVSRTFRLEA